MRADNSTHLKIAARQRHEQTRVKAIAAMHELDRAGAVLTFESVARHAGVSRSWIYTQADIKDEIRRLRELSQRQPRAPIPAPQAPATTRYATASNSPTTATANSPTRTSGCVANSHMPSANSAIPAQPAERPGHTPQLANKQFALAATAIGRRLAASKTPSTTQTSRSQPPIGRELQISIESMISIGRHRARNVKRWRDGKMAMRWCAAGMIEAGKQFRRVNGHLHLATLRAALERDAAKPVAPVVHNDHVSAA